MRGALDRDRPDAVAAVGLLSARVDGAASLGGRDGRPAILMSESQAIDHPARLVEGGGQAPAGPAVLRGAGRAGRGTAITSSTSGCPRADRPGLQRCRQRRIRRATADALRGARRPARACPRRLISSPSAGSSPEKNLVGLDPGVRALPQRGRDGRRAWDLVLCGDGPGRGEIEDAVAASGCAGSIHRPGFLQAGELRAGTRSPRRSCIRA